VRVGFRGFRGIRRRFNPPKPIGQHKLQQKHQDHAGAKQNQMGNDNWSSPFSGETRGFRALFGAIYVQSIGLSKTLKIRLPTKAPVNGYRKGAKAPMPLVGLKLGKSMMTAKTPLGANDRPNL
jgi:hypothetical protein